MSKRPKISAEETEKDKRMNYALNEKTVFIKALFDIESPDEDMEAFDKEVTFNLTCDGHRLSNMCTALHYACHYDNLSLVKHFVERGWNVNSRNSKKETPLHILLQRRKINSNIVDYLIRNGADVNAADYLSSTLLDVATKNSHVSAVRSILQHPCKNLTKSFYALYNAVCAESAEIVEMLLANGFNSNVYDNRTSYSFKISCEHKNPYITLLLLQDSNFATPDTVLDQYIYHLVHTNRMHPKVIELLLKLGMKRSSIKLLSSYSRKKEVTDFNTLTSNLCTLKQLSRIAIRDMFYSKWSHLSINEIVKNLGLPDPVYKYLRYKTENIS